MDLLIDRIIDLAAVAYLPLMALWIAAGLAALVAIIPGRRDRGERTWS